MANLRCVALSRTIENFLEMLRIIVLLDTIFPRKSLEVTFRNKKTIREFVIKITPQHLKA